MSERQGPAAYAEPVLVRVSPEILELLESGQVEPVVLLGATRAADGTYDLILRTVELPAYREALVNVERVARELDEMFGGDFGRWRLNGWVINDVAVEDILLRLHDYLNDVARVRDVPRGAPGCTCGTPPFAPPEPSEDCPFHGAERR